MRIAVVTVHESWVDTKPTYRLCEADGAVADCWLPGCEPPDPEGPLDRGGFDQRLDAQAFALGIDYERALFGLIAESTEDIDTERAQLDTARTINGANARKTDAVSIWGSGPLLQSRVRKAPLAVTAPRKASPEPL